MGIEQVLGGFAKGFGQARMMKMQREKDKESTALQKQMLQLKIKESEAALIDKKRKADFEKLLLQSPKFQQVFGINPAATEGAAEPYQKTGFGESFKKEESVTDMMASMDPVMAALLAKTTGYDFLGAGRLSAQQEGLDLRKQQFAREEKEFKITDIPDASGGSTKVMLPKFGGPGTALGYSPGPTEFEEKVEKGVTKRRIINKTTKEPIGQWREVSGKKGMPGEAAGKLGMVQSGLSDLKLAKDILMPGGVVDKKRIFEMAVPGGGLPKSEGREAKAYLLNAMEGKIRIESGAAVPDQEMDRLALRFMPSLLDSDKLIKAKLNRLESYLAGVVEKLDPNKMYTEGTIVITAENGEQLAWVPKGGGGKTKMPDPLGIR